MNIKDIIIKDGEMIVRAALVAVITTLAGALGHITASEVFDAHEWISAVSAAASAGVVAVRHQIHRLTGGSD